MFLRTITAALVAAAPALAQESRETVDWSGAYGGLFVGALSSDGEAVRGGYEGALLSRDVDNGLFPEERGDHEAAPQAGLVGGYNLQRGRYVFGLELDWGWADLDAAAGFSRIDPTEDERFRGVETATGYGTHLGGLATARLRAGYAVARTLIYATGGVAVADVENRFSLELTELGYASEWSAEGHRVGYVVGAGIERRVSARTSLRAELMYVDLEDATVRASDPATFPGESIAYEFENAGALARIGVTIAF